MLLIKLMFHLTVIMLKIMQAKDWNEKLGRWWKLLIENSYTMSNDLRKYHDQTDRYKYFRRKVFE